MINQSMSNRPVATINIQLSFIYLLVHVIMISKLTNELVKTVGVSDEC